MGIFSEMDEYNGWGVSSVNEAAKCFQVISPLCSRAFCCIFIYFLCGVCVWSFKLSIPYLIANWRSMSVYMYLLKCPTLWYVLPCICVMSKLYVCVYVCVCHCVLSASKSVWQSAVVLLLFSCCRRNTVVAKLRLLPCCHISCSRFPPWLRTWPPFILKHHLLPLQAAGSPAAVGLNSRLIPIHVHINRNVMESTCELDFYCLWQTECIQACSLRSILDEQRQQQELFSLQLEIQLIMT